MGMIRSLVLLNCVLEPVRSPVRASHGSVHAGPLNRSGWRLIYRRLCAIIIFPWAGIVTLYPTWFFGL